MFNENQKMVVNGAGNVVLFVEENALVNCAGRWAGDELLSFTVEAAGGSPKIENIVQADDSTAIITLKIRAAAEEKLSCEV